MAVPPTYGDLGKSTRDLFSKGYNFGFYKLDCKTTTNSGIEFKTTGSNNHDSGKVNANLESKYKWKDYGVTLTEKWNTNNTIGSELTADDAFVKGLKLTFETTFSPQSNKKTGCVKTAYKQDHINVNCNVDLEYAGPIINAAAVMGYTGWLAGYQMTFDTAKSALTKSNFAAGYTGSDFTLHANVNDGKEFAGSYFHKINKDLESGVQLSHTMGAASRFGLAAKYTPDKETTIRAKVNNALQVGLSHQHKIRSGVTMTLSAQVEGKNINEGGHKIGMGLDLEA